MIYPQAGSGYLVGINLVLIYYFTYIKIYFQASVFALRYTFDDLYIIKTEQVKFMEKKFLQLFREISDKNFFAVSDV